MKIKNQEELANVLGMAFRNYCAVVATGRNIDAFLPFIDGEENITIIAKLSNQGEISFHTIMLTSQLTVEPIVLGTPITCEDLACDNKSIIDSFDEPVLEAPVEETVEEKPKRRRKTI